MRILFICLSIFAIAALSACGKSEPQVVTTSAPAAKDTSAVKAAAPVNKPVVAAVEEDEAFAYVAVTATHRETGEKIQVQVPDNIELTSGRLMEYRQAADGTYYFKSLIPQ